LTPFGLASLTYPLSLQEFLGDYWPGTPFITHGLSETVRTLRDLPHLQSLDALLNSCPDDIKAHLPDASDESSAVSASPLDARKLFKNRMGLLFNNVHLRSPVLTSALASIKRDLGLPLSTQSRCMVYATADGKGTAPHFDQNVNFVLQLHGTKRWWLAPNTHVENPTERFTIGQPIDPELESYLTEALPSAMPENREEFVLKPGSMLFVPRGTWHSTEAEGDALALNFTFNQPCWADLLTAALRSRLLLSPEWRALADGVSSLDREKRAAAEASFEELLLEFAADLPEWRASDILASTEGA
jgi:50S ribosomal protein L16 3-hydroxylase